MKIYGKNPVLERIKADPKSVRKIYVEMGHAELGYIATKARKYKIPLVTVPTSAMSKFVPALVRTAEIVNPDGRLEAISMLLVAQAPSAPENEALSSVSIIGVVPFVVT